MKKWLWIILIILLFTFILLGYLYFIGKRQYQSKISPDQTLESGTLELKNKDSILEQSQKAYEIVGKYSKDPQLYYVIIDKMYGSFNFDQPDNSFAFYDSEENFDMLFSVIPETGEYKLTKTTIKIISNNEQINLEGIKDFPEALSIVQKYFQNYDIKNPDSENNYIATLAKRSNQNFLWRFVYGGQNSSPVQIDIDPKNLTILEVYPEEYK